MTRDDAVTFGYIVVTSYDTDFHLADKAPSRTHSFRRRPESRMQDALTSLDAGFRRHDGTGFEKVIYGTAH